MTKISRGQRAHLLALCERATQAEPVFDFSLVVLSEPMRSALERFSEEMRRAHESWCKMLLGSFAVMS